MRILLFGSAFDGLAQRVWIELRRAGHDVTVEPSASSAALRDAISRADPDLVLCPTPPPEPPEDLGRYRRTVVVHPAPVDEIAPGALDRAILDGVRGWAVTALDITENPGEGPVGDGRICSTARFPMPDEVRSKSAVQRGPLADAALDVIHDAVVKVADPGFTPVPLSALRPAAPAGRRIRPAASTRERTVIWGTDTSAEVLRKIAASDNRPGAPCELGGERLLAFDARPAPGARSPATASRFRRDGAVLVATADGAVWVGHLQRAGEPVLPARAVLERPARGPARAGPGRLTDPAAATDPDAAGDAPDLGYRRVGGVGWIDLDLYGGALSADHCRRLRALLLHARSQDTRVIVLRGGATFFATGIHLGLAAVARRPAVAAWENIEAMNDLVEEVLTCGDQITVAAVTGDAAAGGVMLALAADVVAARSGVVLNPHYAGTGLSGCDYSTYTLPRRVGPGVARDLTSRGLPVGIVEAARLGLVDHVLPRDPRRCERALTDLVTTLAGPRWEATVRQTRDRLAADTALTPLRVYRARELARVSTTLFGPD